MEASEATSIIFQSNKHIALRTGGSSSSSTAPSDGYIFLTSAF